MGIGVSEASSRKQAYEVELMLCQCCGRSIKDDYQFCIACERKRMKVLSDCIGAGMSVEDARRVVERVYPVRGARASKVVERGDGKVVERGADKVLFDKGGQRYVLQGDAWVRRSGK